MKLYKQEFPDFDFEIDTARLAGAGFEDRSWHNDAMPLFCKGDLSLAVDYKRLDLRESCHERVYTLYREFEDHSEWEFLKDTDSLDEILTFINNLAE